MAKIKNLNLIVLFMMLNICFVVKANAKDQISRRDIKECVKKYQKELGVNPDIALESCGLIVDLKNNKEITRCVVDYREVGVTTDVAFNFCTELKKIENK